MAMRLAVLLSCALITSCQSPNPHPLSGQDLSPPENHAAAGFEFEDAWDRDVHLGSPQAPLEALIGEPHQLTRMERFGTWTAEAGEPSGVVLLTSSPRMGGGIQVTCDGVEVAHRIRARLVEVGGGVRMSTGIQAESEGPCTVEGDVEEVSTWLRGAMYFLLQRQGGA